MSIDVFIVVNVILHNDKLMIEKSLHDLTAEKFNSISEVNNITLVIIDISFLSSLNKGQQSIFIALSARMVSISDNRLGGWRAYGNSKESLNMFIKMPPSKLVDETSKSLSLDCDEVLT